MRLTLQEVIEDAKEVIKGKEDYVYVDPLGNTAGVPRTNLFCVYFDTATGQPSCIVGHIFARHGITYENVVHNNVNFVGDALQEAKVEAEPRAVDFMRKMQSSQDMGVTWGAAYAKAIKEVS